jgi:tRNA pseudouridine 55 synthase
MNGLLIIDKPEGITSHDVVACVRRILRTKRVGHTGTLDPFATGVMVILVGKATRLARFLDKDVKEYEAVVRLGFETHTGDRTGLKIQSSKFIVESARQFSSTEIEEVLNKFKGKIEQIPPMYSAKKIGGKKLYELARQGKEIERKPAKVTIYELEQKKCDNRTDLDTVTLNLELRVVCSSGTYIRTLAEDMGRTLGTGAHLEELRRTRSGKFDISQSITLDALGKLDDPKFALVPLEKAVNGLPVIVLTPERVEKTKNGLSTIFESAELADGQPMRMLTESEELIAIGFYNADEKVVQPKVVLV